MITNYQVQLSFLADKDEHRTSHGGLVQRIVPLSKRERYLIALPPVPVIHSSTSMAGLLTSMDHGNEVVTITVGLEDNSSRTFTLHKNLICMHSDYFRKAFTSTYKEGNDGHMNLPEDWPESFEVFYGWLYSGQVEAADFYTKGLISPALFWVSVYLMSDRLLVGKVRSIAFDRLKEIFNDKLQVIPNARFVEELFTYGSPHDLLEAYVIRHSVFWLTTSSQIDSFGWEMALKAHERFGVGVAVQIAKVVSSDYKGSKLHPCLEVKLDGNIDFDIPNDDQQASADDDKEVSLFSYARPPTLLWSKLGPSIAVFHG
jgi:hypothetical protein